MPFNYETGRLIKLSHGEGNGVDQACLMTASNMLIGRGEDGDDNSCVCPLLRKFIIKTNDAMPVEWLSELYGPLAWEILGTRNDSPEVLQQRAFTFADWAVREVAPIALEALGEQATALRALDPVVDEKTARAAYAYAAASSAAYASVSAYAYAAASSAAYASVSAYAYAAASSAAYASAYAAASVWRMCPDIIMRVAAIGDKRPVECVISCEDLEEALS